MARILAISNPKAGVGKTTTAVNLSAALALCCGQRVLLIDLDPQGNASSGLGYPKSQVRGGIYDALLLYCDLEAVILPTSVDGLDLAPATRDLVGAEIELAEEDGRERRLRKIVSRVRDRYDWVIFDCPPNLGLLTVNALTTAHGVLVPVQAEVYGIDGLGPLLHTTRAVRRRLNPDLERETVLITLTDPNNNLCVAVEHQAREMFGDEVFRTVIPRNVRLGEAPSYGRSIVEHDPRSRGSRAYTRLAREVIERVHTYSRLEVAQ